MTLQLLILSMFLLILTSIQVIQCFSETGQLYRALRQKIGYTPRLRLPQISHEGHSR